MLQPIAFGRKVPPTDWEGDDFVPGSGGHYVTCMDTATGRAAYWATDGHVNVDGKQVRRAVSPPDPNGIDLRQAQQAIHSLTGLTMVAANMTLSQKLTWLRAGKGLVVPGLYSAVPRAYRFQARADFTHAIFFAYITHDGKNVRKFDPLNPNIHTYGEQVPLSEMKAFLNSLPTWQVGYIPLR